MRPSHQSLQRQVLRDHRRRLRIRVLSDHVQLLGLGFCARRSQLKVRLITVSASFDNAF